MAGPPRRRVTIRLDRIGHTISPNIQRFLTRRGTSARQGAFRWRLLRWRRSRQSAERPRYATLLQSRPPHKPRVPGCAVDRRKNHTGNHAKRDLRLHIAIFRPIHKDGQRPVRRVIRDDDRQMPVRDAIIICGRHPLREALNARTRPPSNIQTLQDCCTKRPSQHFPRRPETREIRRPQRATLDIERHATGLDRRAPPLEFRNFAQARQLGRRPLHHGQRKTGQLVAASTAVTGSGRVSPAGPGSCSDTRAPQKPPRLGKR